MLFTKLNINFFFLFIIGIMGVQQLGTTLVFADQKIVSETQIKIVLNETSLVKSSDILLGDIAAITANDFLKEALEKVVMGSSPRPGKIRSFDQKKIMAILHGQRYLPETITIISPERIYVKRMSQKVSPQDVRRFVDRQLAQIFKNKAYELTSFNVRGLETYPQGKIEFRSRSNDYIGSNGKVSLFLEVLIDGEKQDKISVSGSVAVFETVLCTIKACKKGVRLFKENTCLKKKNVFELSGNFIKTFEAIEGKILKSSVQKGAYLTADLFSEPFLVQKGDIITLVSKNENLLIVTSGISREDGFENGLIRVENLTSGKLVRGIVKGKSKVEVID